MFHLCDRFSLLHNLHVLHLLTQFKNNSFLQCESHLSPLPTSQTDHTKLYRCILMLHLYPFQQVNSGVKRRTSNFSTRLFKFNYGESGCILQRYLSSSSFKMVVVFVGLNPGLTNHIHMGCLV